MSKEGICAFTGHRPQKFPWKYNETDPRCIALKDELFAQIADLVSNGFTHFLSGMAEGTDIWASESVLSLRENNPALKLHCILPCTTQADKWPAESKKVYQSILRQADSIVFVNRDYKRSCMLDRNHFLIEHASTLLAVYNGSQRSGTAATIRYARKADRNIILIDPITLQISYEPPIT